MTPKEKAKELYNRFATLKTDNEAEPPNQKIWYFVSTPLLKDCALMCVEEILKIKAVDCRIGLKDYWNKVIIEINKL